VADRAPPASAPIAAYLLAAPAAGGRWATMAVSVRTLFFGEIT
jgi:hypothetical protein